MDSKDRQKIENLFSQVSDMISKIQNYKNSSSLVISPAAFEELERLKKNIEAFEEMTQADLKLAGIDKSCLRFDAFKSDTLSEKDKKLFERAQSIENDAKHLKSHYTKAIEKNKAGKSSTQASVEKKITERKNRFKPLGGNKNWIPL